MLQHQWVRAVSMHPHCCDLGYGVKGSLGVKSKYPCMHPQLKDKSIIAVDN